MAKFMVGARVFGPDRDEEIVVNGPPTKKVYKPHPTMPLVVEITEFRCDACNEFLPQNELHEYDVDGVHKEWRCVPCSRRWYAVAVEPQKDNRVRKELAKQVKIHSLEDAVAKVMSPGIKVEAIKETRKGDTQRFMRTDKVTPGYVVVRAFLSPEVVHLVKGLKFVWGFLPLGADPVPLSDEEADRLLEAEKKEQEVTKQEKKAVTLPYEVGEEVGITSGPFKGSRGVVEKIEGDPTSPQTTVKLGILGQVVPVTLPWFFFTKNRKDLTRVDRQIADALQDD